MQRFVCLIYSCLMLLCLSCSREKPSEIPSAGQENASETKKSTETKQITSEDKEIIPEKAQAKNFPPSISRIKIIPEIFRPGDKLGVEASAEDPDGDEATIIYEWSRNGDHAGSGSFIEGTVRRGDRISLKAVPFDGKTYGYPVFLHREIQNMPPVIREDLKFTFNGKLYTYQVKASDPDGDSLAYSLKSAPAGMTIEPSTGLIKWDVPSDFKGEAPATISVTDGHGGEAVYNIKVIIGPESKE